MKKENFFTPFKPGKEHILYGKTSHNKGKKFPHTKAWEKRRIKAVREAKRRIGYVPTGRPPTKKVMESVANWRRLNPEKAREIAIRNLSKNGSMSLSGKNSPWWNGGKTKKIQKWKNKHWKEFARFRISVLERDNHICKECGSNENLHVHHIASVSEHPEFAFLRMNGVTLCQKCHYKTDNFGSLAIKPKRVGQTRALTMTIPHKYRDYNTIGNWGIGTNGSILILVSDLDNEDYHFLVSIHEQIEQYLCEKRGITQKEVDDFDIAFEENRKHSITLSTAEPGDSPAAPYRREHFFSTTIERLLASELGVDWTAYESAINALP